MGRGRDARAFHEACNAFVSGGPVTDIPRPNMHFSAEGLACFCQAGQTLLSPAGQQEVPPLVSKQPCGRLSKA